MTISSTTFIRFSADPEKTNQGGNKKTQAQIPGEMCLPLKDRIQWPDSPPARTQAQIPGEMGLPLPPDTIIIHPPISEKPPIVSLSLEESGGRSLPPDIVRPNNQ